MPAVGRDETHPITAAGSSGKAIKVRAQTAASSIIKALHSFILAWRSMPLSPGIAQRV